VVRCVATVAQEPLVSIGYVGGEACDKFDGRKSFDMFLVVVRGGAAIADLLALSEGDVSRVYGTGKQGSF